jgi:hypothetical protein
MPELDLAACHAPEEVEAFPTKISMGANPIAPSLGRELLIPTRTGEATRAGASS